MERIIMTPKEKTANSTRIDIKRCLLPSVETAADAHVGGGQHKGIVINKTITNDKSSTAADLELEFKVFLLNEKTESHTQEKRKLSFWFTKSIDSSEHAKVAQEFFKELVAPLNFPRDYTGFILKLMKMMQYGYKSLTNVEILLTQCEQSDVIAPQIPEELKDTLSEDKILEVIESFYPNPIILDQLNTRWPSAGKEILLFAESLKEKGYIKCLAPGVYTRIVYNETDIQVVRQMPTIASNQQPTIAIITAQYCEKLAANAMIENQETFVRYTTVGESNVYTLGNIGAHRVVCTKLPQVGHDRSSSIAAGNTTTRLLGTFQEVDHVFLIGVSGGIPHYTDYNRHVRLGDIVIGAPGQGHDFIYTQLKNETSSNCIEEKYWKPKDLILQEIAYKLKQMGESESKSQPWLSYIEEGKTRLKPENLTFDRPPDDTDILYMSIGGSDVIQVSHPTPADGNKRSIGEPRIHLGLIGSGQREDSSIGLESNLVAFDQEFGPVLESVVGNCKDRYVIVRGIADYKDGKKGKEWQPYAALSAAAFAKCIICALDPPNQQV